MVGRALTAVAVLTLAGCTVSGQEAAPNEPTAAIEGDHLRASAAVLDPTADDVAGVEACDGRSGRDVLESFERASWPELGVAAGEGVLTCGDADGAGWRHIADGHTGDFAELGDLVGAGWEDVAWFAIEQALEQPTVVEEYRDGIVNYDVLVEYVASGEVERAWMVTVGVGLDSGTVITAFPDERFG